MLYVGLVFLVTSVIDLITFHLSPSRQNNVYVAAVSWRWISRFFVRQCRRTEWIIWIACNL